MITGELRNVESLFYRLSRVLTVIDRNLIQRKDTNAIYIYALTSDGEKAIDTGVYMVVDDMDV